MKKQKLQKASLEDFKNKTSKQEQAQLEQLTDSLLGNGVASAGSALGIGT